MPKLSPEALRLVRDAAEAERAVGSAKLATALEMLVEWHERQDDRKTVTIVEPIASRAVLDVIAERIRQVVGKGYSAQHDDRHADGQIITADWGVLARLTAAAAWLKSGIVGRTRNDGPMRRYRSLLVEGAAMAIAEIDRIDRAAATPTTPETGG